MKIKTSELTGAALDWAVARCEPDGTLAIYFDEDTGEPLCHDDWEDNQEYKPSTDWMQGGPLIERENICLWSEGYDWEAKIQTASGEWLAEWDEYPLIAAMRCYVASKMGDEVEIPEELTK